MNKWECILRISKLTWFTIFTLGKVALVNATGCICILTLRIHLNIIYIGQLAVTEQRINCYIQNAVKLHWMTLYSFLLYFDRGKFEDFNVN